MSNEPEDLEEDPPTGVREPLPPKNPPKKGGAEAEPEPEYEFEPHELMLI
jgi:hypothetical protein